MSSTLFETQVKIGMNDLDFKKGIAEAGNLMKGFASVGVQAIGSVTSAVVDMSKSFANSVSELASYGDHIDKQSQKMNMSAKAYQEWDAIMQHSGTTIDSMQISMKTLANAADSDSEAFSRLGMSLDDVKAMSSEQLFAATITALQNVENETERTAIASDLLGRGATELGALLNTSAEDTEKMRQRVHELGGVMSDEAVKASAKFTDSLRDMKTSIAGLTRGLKSDFLPSFTEVIDGITKVFAGEEGGEDMISSGLSKIAEGLGNAAQKLKPIVKRLGTSFFNIIKNNAPVLIKNFIEDLPKYIDEAGGLFMTLGTAVMDSLPQLADAAYTTITKFTGFLRDNLPEIIPAGVDAVLEFAKGITDPDSIGKIADTAFDVVDGFIEGLTAPETLDSIIENAPVIVDNVVKGINKVVDRLFDSASLMCMKLVEYFSDKKNREKLEECSEKILDSIADGFTHLLESAGTSIYNLGGQIAQNIGLADYWTVGDEAFGDFWKGFKSDWEEFKTWFNIEWKDLLSPLSLVNSVKDSVTNKMSEVFQEKEKGETKPAFNYDALETLPDAPVYGPSPLPEEYRKKHGSLADRHAKGGIFAKPYYASGDWFGENGREALLPLDNNTSWMDKLVDKINGGKNIITVNLTVEGGLSSDYDTDRLVERLSEKLAQLNIMQTRAIGGTGYGG